jgi:CRP-like cAMP-binding protein
MEMPSPNRLVASLSPDDLALVGPHLRTIELVHGKVLTVAGDDLHDAYFPHNGVISLVVRLVRGETTEIAMIGKDSVFGASAAFVGPTALTTGIVQSPGMCSVLSIKRLQAAADQSKTFRTKLALNEEGIFVQAQHAAGCIASHIAIARLAGWLLRARDAADSDQLHFTQEFLGQMLGVQRNAVSFVAGGLKEKGLIRFGRADIRILDVPGLKATACECYETVRVELNRLKHSEPR